MAPLLHNDTLLHKMILNTHDFYVWVTIYTKIIYITNDGQNTKVSKVSHIIYRTDIIALYTINLREYNQHHG